MKPPTIAFLLLLSMDVCFAGKGALVASGASSLTTRLLSSPVGNKILSVVSQRPLREIEALEMSELQKERLLEASLDQA